MEEPLTDFKRSQFCAILLLGCDRATACKFLGLSIEQLAAEIERNAEFAQQAQHSEAKAEVDHMRNVRSAALEKKNWRTSVWWLERQERELAGPEDSLLWNSPATVRATLNQLTEIVMVEVDDPIRRQTVIAELLRIESQIARDDAATDAEPAGSAVRPPLDAEVES